MPIKEQIAKKGHDSIFNNERRKSDCSDKHAMYESISIWGWAHNDFGKG